MPFKHKPTAAILGCCVLLIVVAAAFWLYREVQYRDDVINNWSNLGRVYTRLTSYKDAHGCYPEQQDMKSLLETLELDESELYHVKMFDIHSAEYRVPTQDSETPVLSMRIKRHVFGKEGLFVMLEYQNCTFDNEHFDPENFFQ